LLAQAEQRATSKIALVREGVQKGLLSEGEEHLFEGEKYRLRAQKKGLKATVAALQNEIIISVGISCAIKTQGNFQQPALPSEKILLNKATQNTLSQSQRIDLQLKSEYPPRSGWFAGFCSLEGSGYIINAIY
jgi:hypothetical protein